MAIAFGGAVYSWRSGQIIGLFICSGVLWILFAVQQTWCIYTTETDRVFPIEFLKSYELCILFAQTATSIAAGFISIYFIPIFFQFIQNDSALKAGVRLLPFVMFMVFAIILNGAVMGKTGYYMPWYLAGGMLIIVGGTLLRTVDLDTSSGRIYGYSIVTATGTGMFSQASFPVAQGKVNRSRIPSAVAFIGLAQITGITLALTISNSIFINQSTSKISTILPNVPVVTVQQAISGAGGSLFQTLSADNKIKVLKAIMTSISNVYIMVITAGALAVVLAVFMKREKLFLGPGGHGA